MPAAHQYNSSTCSTRYVTLYTKGPPPPPSNCPPAPLNCHANWSKTRSLIPAGFPCGNKINRACQTKRHGSEIQIFALPLCLSQTTPNEFLDKATRQRPLYDMYLLFMRTFGDVEGPNTSAGNKGSTGHPLVCPTTTWASPPPATLFFFSLLSDFSAFIVQKIPVGHSPTLNSHPPHLHGKTSTATFDGLGRNFPHTNQDPSGCLPHGTTTQQRQTRQQ